MAVLPNVNSGDPHVSAHNAERTEINAHAARSDNPHATTKAQVGLGSVDNTTDVAKPVSTAQAAATTAAINAHLAASDPHSQYGGPRGSVTTLIDINTLIAPGAYRISGPTGYTSTNMPVAKAGIMIVDTYSIGGSTCTQTYWEDSGECYTRNQVAGVWKTWARFDNARLLYGTGSPEGVVTAPVGTEYVDSAKTNGAFKWIKNTGSTATGWIVTSGDTGFMDVSSLFDIRTDGVAFTSYLRRTNNIVDIFIDIQAPTDLTSPWTVFNVPLGFRPNNTRYGGMIFYNETITRTTIVSSVINYYTPKAGRDRGSGTWTTVNAWPTVLPV